METAFRAGRSRQCIIFLLRTTVPDILVEKESHPMSPCFRLHIEKRSKKKRSKYPGCRGSFHAKMLRRCWPQSISTSIYNHLRHRFCHPPLTRRMISSFLSFPHTHTPLLPSLILVVPHLTSQPSPIGGPKLLSTRSHQKTRAAAARPFP